MFTGLEPHTSHDSNESLNDAAPLIALAATPLVVVIAVATLMALKVEAQVEGDEIAGIVLLLSNEITSHTY